MFRKVLNGLWICSVVYLSYAVAQLLYSLMRLGLYLLLF